ncbi:MAG: UbiD family decarboxylase [Thermodesulfobacteriota bacterium]
MFPCRDVRAFIEALEKEGELVRVDAEVDCNLELAAIVSRASAQDGKALLFERIKGYPEGYSFLANTLGSYSRVALALGLDKDTPAADIVSVCRQRIKTPLKPRLVSRAQAPCKENIHADEELDLFEFPTPFWHRGDGGRYFGTFHCLAVKDPDSSWVNVALCRLMIHSEGELGILMEPGQHTDLIYQKYKARGQNMPVAISVGQDPVNVIAASASFEAGVCEWDIAGALREAPVEMVACETLDMAVPATSEIVIEGEVLVDELKEEGPFGEFTGYYGGSRAPRPFIRINCLTHRHQPVHTGSLEGKPVLEDHIMSGLMASVSLENYLKGELNLGIKQAFVHPWGAGLGLIVSLKPRFPGYVNRVAHAVWSIKAGRAINFILAVDEDIDPTDLNQVLWAICTRCKPDRDIHIALRSQTTSLWPALTPDERRQGLGSKALIDATFPPEWPREWVPVVSDWWDYPEDIRARVESRWESYGL